MGWSYLQSYKYVFNNSMRELPGLSECNRRETEILNRKSGLVYELSRLFRFHESIANRSRAFVESIRHRHGNNSVLVGVHVRRGLFPLFPHVFHSLFSKCKLVQYFIFLFGQSSLCFLFKFNMIGENPSIFCQNGPN